jgi:penicillin-binding protein 1B
VLKKLLAIAAVLLFLLALAFYAVDRRVQNRLNALNSSSLPAIYSSPLDLAGYLSRVVDEPARVLEQLRAMLNARRYIEVTGPPVAAGEFSIQGSQLVIITRSFRTASGDLHPSSKGVLPLGPASNSEKTGANTETDSNRITTPLLLEPQAISFIGRDDLRASTFTPLSQIPLRIQRAVIAIEDERFYSHMGLDITGIARALFRNIVALRLVQGGSTLTQQLAKNLVLSPKRTLSRKLLEIPAALSLERHLSKEKLLELYLNEVYLGQEGSVAIHGVTEAASGFFGKRVHDISLAQAATLAGIIRAPSTLSPRKYPKRAVARRNTVLKKMKELGFITELEYTNAAKEPLKTAAHTRHRKVAPYFTTAVEGELGKLLELQAARSSGLSVYTGFELGMQLCAERAVTNAVQRLEKAYPRLAQKKGGLQAALVAIEPYSGLVKAWVGGRDFSKSQFNRVNQSHRQIGSIVKPFLYLTALDRSLNDYKVASPVSILEDKPMEISLRRQATWIPENYDHDFRGDVTLRYALENSLNMPAIYVAQRVGIPALKRTLEAFELAKSAPLVPSLALGAVDATLLKVTAAYGTLANSGTYVQPRLFISALDNNDERLATADIREQQVADESAVFVLTSILEGVLSRGTGKSARNGGFTRPAAGKTGTSNDTRDAWFVGFTPNLATGVWIGLDDNTPLGVTGGSAAAPVWGEFMSCSAPLLPLSKFVQPRGVTEVLIDSESGQRATDRCPQASISKEVFTVGSEPKRECPLHGNLSPDSETPRDDTYRMPRLPPATLEESSPQRRREVGFWDSLFGRTSDD